MTLRERPAPDKSALSPNIIPNKSQINLKTIDCVPHLSWRTAIIPTDGKQMIGSVTLIDYLIVIQVKLQFLPDQATSLSLWLLTDHYYYHYTLPEFWLAAEEDLFCSVSTQNTKFSPQQSLGEPRAQLLFTVKCLLERSSGSARSAQ